MVNEVALVIDEHLLASARFARIARHDVVVMKAHDLTCSAQLIGFLAVPYGQQDMTVRGEKDAELGVALRRFLFLGAGVENEYFTRRLAQGPESNRRRVVVELAQVVGDRHRQWHIERHVHFDRDLGSEHVCAFGQR